MARPAQGVVIKPTPPTEPRPKPILDGLSPHDFSVEMDNTYVEAFDKDSVILLPLEYIESQDDSASARWHQNYNARRCWQTCIIYERIGETHPRLARFLRRDLWTALPILAKPSGPALDTFLAQHTSIYSSISASRVLPIYRPLIYQWAIQLISGLEFVHTKEIIFGDFNTSYCWLSSSLSLSIVGFTRSGFSPSIYGGMIYPGESENYGFHPFAGLRGKDVVPTYQTDLFFWGYTVYHLMTGFRLEAQLDCPWQDIELMFSRKDWPVLEREYMGQIIHKCWKQEYQNATDIKKDVISFLDHEGWGIENEDELVGFVANDLFQE